MKSLLIIIALSLSTEQLYPQRIDLQISAGYGFSKGGVPLSTYDQVASGSDISNSLITIQNRHDTYFSLSQGTMGTAQANVFLSDNFSAFMALSHSGGSQTSNTRYFFPAPPILSPPNFSENASINYNSTRIDAGLQFQSGVGFIEPFAGMGVGYYFPATFTIAEDNQGVFTTTRYTTNAPIGFISYVGVNLRISPEVAIFISARAALVTYYITRSEITDYQFDGASQLGSLTTEERITDYEEDKNYTTSTANEENFPRNGGPPIPAPAGTIAVTGGFSFTL